MPITYEFLKKEIILENNLQRVPRHNTIMASHNTMTIMVHQLVTIMVHQLVTIMVHQLVTIMMHQLVTIMVHQMGTIMLVSYAEAAKLGQN